MKYFAYGSNMSLARLTQRVPSAKRIGTYQLPGYDLRFHKAGKDNSGKCDAYYTGNSEDVVIGALYEMPESERPALDAAEGLGVHYNDKIITVLGQDGESLEAMMYYAIDINLSVKPFCWYLNHVLIGAREINVPDNYLAKIQAIDSVLDQDTERNTLEYTIHA
jgi:gamma-glutamylcyclotransferase (GGCT)/AIG2-like uncharacterized protein YtfP